MQQLRFGRLRRTLRVEALEDRTLLSGLVIAMEDPMTGLLSIFGDNGNNAITISQISPGVLRVSGDINIPPPPSRPDVTSVNGVTFHDFTLGTISAISVLMLNGTDKVTMAGFSIPGNISITAGSGQDTFSLSSIQTNAGIISITAAGPGADTVALNNVVAGAATIAAGAGADNVSLDNVTIGSVNISTGTGTANDTITVSNSLGTPLRAAIGLLNIQASDGNNTIAVTNTTLVNAVITTGNGNNTLSLDGSTMASARITAGTESVGAVGKNTVEVNNDTISGTGLTLNVLNESGVSGVLPGGGKGTSPGSLNTVTMNNNQFTGGGNLNIRVDDGVPYSKVDSNGNTVLTPASSFTMLNDTGIGTLTCTLGDFFQIVTLGSNPTTAVNAKALTFSLGNEADIVQIDTNVAGGAGYTVGNVSTIPVPPLPPPSFTIAGSVGTKDNPQNLNVQVGNGWPLTVSSTVIGNEVITAATGDSITVTSPSVSGNLSITAGDNTQSIAVTGTTAQNLTILQVGMVGNTYFYLNGDTVNNLSLTTGDGNNTLALLNLNVVEALFVTNGAGINTIVAQNVTCLFGLIDGGSGPSNIYVDRGGNFGFFVFDIVGRILGPFPPQLDASNLNLSATTINQGDSVTLTGTFDQGGNWDSHTVTINWGDGSAIALLQLAAGVFSFSAAHQFLNETSGSTPDTIKVTVTNSVGDTASASTSITVTDVPPVIPAGGLQVSASTINEGDSTALTGAFVDPGLSSTHQVVIDWGDGSAATLQLGAGVLSFGPISHTYQVALPSDAPYTIQVTVSDEDNASGSASIPVTVKNVPPANINLGFTSATINEGDTATLNGSFTDPGVLDTHSVVIDWGDGSANTTVSLGANVLNFSANHQYQNDLPGNAPYTVRVTVSDANNASSSASIPVTVKNVPPANINLFSNPTINEGDTATLNGRFTDPGVLDTHSVVINWGDGSADTVNLGANILNFSANHQYQNDLPGNAPYTVRVTVSDEDNASSNASIPVTVKNVPPANINLGFTKATITAGDTATLNGSFTDPGVLDTHSVVINWGDGSANTTISLGANTLNFSASHQYQNNPSGNTIYIVQVSVSDEDNASASASTFLSVNQGTSTVGPSTVPASSVKAGPDQTVPEGTAVTLVTNLTDPSSLSGLTFHWTVVSSNGQVIPDGNGPSFTFTPNDDGTYTGTLTVTDSRGGVNTTTTTVIATHVAPTLMLSGAARVDEGSPYTLDLSSREPGADTITSWTITWGDGAVQPVNGNPGSVTHVYPVGPNSYTILAQASDEDGTYDAGNTVVVQVTDVPPTLTLSGPTASNPLSPYTLNLSASDPGTVSITSWTINWGDGTIQPVDGNPSSATHTYALIHRAYTISAQATDGDRTFSAGNTLTVTMSFATANENYIAQVYLDLLGRPVDLGGLQNWTGHLLAGDSRDQVMLWIMSSPEYRTLLVEELYQDYLGRAADPLGLRNDLLAMAAGATTDQIKEGILGSDEYFSLRASGTVTGFFSALYYDVLGRPGTPSEIQTWVQGTPSDTSRTALASVFIGSIEANQFLVQSFYEKYLHRAADPNGLSAFVQAREDGATEEAVIAAILASDEYFQRAVN